MKFSPVTLFPLMLACAVHTTAFADVVHYADQMSLSSDSARPPLEEVFVSSEFREITLLDSSISLSVLDAEVLEARQATHLDDILNIVPNVNFSSGASRGRFIQIRGIGERSQFIDPINPSVGLIIDGIDFTGLGGAATTLDVKQVEVLRGPQGTLYGANALAGLINIVSQDPERKQSTLRLRYGEYNTFGASQVISGPVSDTASLRVAFAKNTSDGFIRNQTLSRKDTNNIDETTFRAKLHWQAADDLLVKTTGYFADVDNGYDAFSLDNTRVTLSDEPGHDRLMTRAGALQFDYSGFQSLQWQTLLSTANTDTEYGFDEDWTSRIICAENSPCAYFQYSTRDNYERQNGNFTFDTRFLSGSNRDELSWVVGFYGRHQSDDLVRTYTNNDPGYDTFYGPVTNPETTLFSSSFNTRNLALYGQVDLPLSTELNLVGGLRLERRDADYSDSNEELIENDERFWGGKIALEYRWDDSQMLYYQVSRGYKAGGNNVPGPVDSNGDDLIPLVFDSEFLWNFEIGHKAAWLDSRVRSQINIFMQKRKEMQVRQSLVTSQQDGEVNGACPCDFTDFIGNVAAGSSSGLEFELVADVTNALELWANMGLLNAEYRRFKSYSHTDADPETGASVNLSGRDVAHAPNMQLAAGTRVQLSSQWSWQLDAEYKDAFYLSSRHDVTTQNYTLLNTRLTWENTTWQLSLWGKNLTDKDPIVRGFGSFGNDPRGCDGSLDGGGEQCYAKEPYYQFGAPRTVGVSALLNFE